MKPKKIIIITMFLSCCAVLTFADREVKVQYPSIVGDYEKLITISKTELAKYNNDVSFEDLEVLGNNNELTIKSGDKITIGLDEDGTVNPNGTFDLTQQNVKANEGFITTELVADDLYVAEVVYASGANTIWSAKINEIEANFSPLSNNNWTTQQIIAKRQNTGSKKKLKTKNIKLNGIEFPANNTGDENHIKKSEKLGWITVFVKDTSGNLKSLKVLSKNFTDYQNMVSAQPMVTNEAMECN